MEALKDWLLQNSLYIVLAVATGFSAYWLLRFRDRLRIKAWVAVLLAVVHTLVGVLCVKAFAFLESGEAGSMSLFGAVFFLPVLYFAGAKIFKRSIADVFDIFAICVIATLLCSRFNCLASGCCLGRVIPGTDGLRWPNREMEILFYLLMLFFLWKRVGKPEFLGMVYPVYMFAYGIFRFVVECVRTSNTTGIFHLSHVWAAVSAIVGMSVYFEMRVRRQEKTKKRR